MSFYINSISEVKGRSRGIDYLELLNNICNFNIKSVSSTKMLLSPHYKQIPWPEM